MRAWLPAFLTSLWVAQGLSLTAATARGAAFAAAVLLASGVSNATGGWLSDRLGRARTIVVVLTASGLCSVLIGWTAPLGLAVVLTLAIVYGLLVTAESSTLSTAVAESAEPDALGTTMAVQSSLGFLVTAISPPLFGAILDFSGGTWGWAFASLGLAALVGVLTILKIHERMPQ
jgi:MFS family permease